jgi:uncharacterized protein with PIN domain
MLFYILIFMFLGAVWYNLDAAFGASVHDRWFSMTHKGGTQPTARCGFIYKRKAKARFYAALFLTIAGYLLLSYWMAFGPLAKLSVGACGLVATFVGFYLGPALHVLWRKKDLVLDQIDRVESGETDVAATVKTAAADLRTEIEEALGGKAERLRDAVADAVESITDHLPDITPRQPAQTPAEPSEVEQATPVSAAENLEQLIAGVNGNTPAAPVAEVKVEEDQVTAARRALGQYGKGGRT